MTNQEKTFYISESQRTTVIESFQQFEIMVQDLSNAIIKLRDENKKLHDENIELTKHIAYFLSNKIE